MFCIGIGLLLLIGCTQQDATPKPYAYHRILLSSKAYQFIQADLPFKFEVDTATRIQWPKPQEEPYWINIYYPTLDATIYLSYLEVNGPKMLGKYIEESQRMTFKHTVKASSIEEILIDKGNERVFGLFYKVGGNAASNSQFYLTDSTKHFVRGAMYFNTAPRADSLAPVVEYVISDIERLLETFTWK
ncbi:MAG: gliding motility lipoprotein GldD [Sphingobacteriaceae bacterium]|nr:gliding motility lipoprotein GldD [Sphingobacteriaceae bacterium]